MPIIVRFDCYEVDLAAGQLLKRGAKIHLREQCFQVLAALIARPGQVVTREELRQRLWPNDVFVDFDNNLNTAIARLREALNDSPERPRFIETLPRHGYRFVGTIDAPASAPEVSPPRRTRLLVLPFVNSSGDPAEESFTDAMTDELITAMASLAPEELAVIARTTAMHYKGTHKDAAQIGRELRVEYLIEGAVRRCDDRIAINVQLVQARDHTHLYAAKFETEIRDVFTLQEAIARGIVTHIPGLGASAGSGLRLPARPRGKWTHDIAAYREFLEGRDLVFQGYALFAGHPLFAKARQHLERAIARDPEFAPPYDALAELYWYEGYFGLMRPRDAFAAGIVHAVRALEIEGNRAETHALLGQFHKTVEYNWREVEREMGIARRLAPNSPLVRMRYAVSGLLPHGRLEEAAAELEQALELDPMSLLARFWLAIVLILARKYDRVLEEAGTLLELDPNSSGAYFVAGIGYRCRGMFSEAIAAHRKALVLGNGAAVDQGWLGLALAASGQVAEARDVLRHLHAMAARGYVPPTAFAWIHLGLKEVDAAFEWLDRAVDECDQLMMPIKTYAFFDPIRDDPRFRALLNKMNLEP